MTVGLTGGAKFYIGTNLVLPGISPAVEFDDDTYVEVKEVENMGQWGDESNNVAFTAIGDNRTRNLKGSRNAGTQALVVGRSPLDPGQIALVAAEKDSLAYNFKIVFNDKQTPGGTGTVQYFRALVSSARNDGGTVDNVTKRMFNINIQTAIFEIPPT